MKRFLSAVFLIAVFTAFAKASAITDEQYDIFNINRLEQAVPDGVEIKTDTSPDLAIDDMLQKLRRGFGDVFTSGLKCAGAIIAISMLTSCIGAFAPSDENPMLQTAISLVGAIAVTAVSANSITGVVKMGGGIIEQINIFSKALLPTLAAAESASGFATAAAAKALAAVFFSDLLITLINYIMLPLVYVNIFCAASNAAVKNEAFGKISNLISKAVSLTLKVLLGAFTAYIAVSGAVGGSIDKIGVKTAKVAAGTVPVVGSVIADATETVLAGAGVVKSTIGVFGLLVVLSACAVPFLTLAVNYIMFRLTSVCAGSLIGGGISELCEGISQSFGLVLAMAASCVLIIFLAVVSAMSGVSVT